MYIQLTLSQVCCSRRIIFTYNFYPTCTWTSVIHIFKKFKADRTIKRTLSATSVLLAQIAQSPDAGMYTSSVSILAPGRRSRMRNIQCWSRTPCSGSAHTLLCLNQNCFDPGHSIAQSHAHSHSVTVISSLRTSLNVMQRIWTDDISRKIKRSFLIVGKVIWISRSRYICIILCQLRNQQFT